MASNQPTSPAGVPSVLPILRWSVWELRLAWRRHRTRHLLGYVERERLGRVSDAVIALSRRHREVRTRTGRVYLLFGPPGHDREAAYSLNGLIRMGGAFDAVDVTAEVLSATDK